ncbi:hypothetical protein [Streptomyces asiaticus]
MTRTRLDRVRASVRIAQLTLQQIEDDLYADDAGQRLIWAARALDPQGERTP